MVNAPEFDVPPPGAGVNTVTDAVPCVAMSEAEIAAWSWVALPNVVVRSAPFQRTTDEPMKLLPVTLSVNAAPPATTVLGDREVSVGLGFGAVIVNVCALEAPPPGVGVNTVTDAVPPAAMSAVVIWACSWVLVTNVVARSLAFHRTTDELMKLVPVAVSVNPAPPAIMLVGAMDVSVGLGFGAEIGGASRREPVQGVGVATGAGAVR